MKYQIDKLEETDVKKIFNINKEQLKSKIDNIFYKDKKNKIASLRKPNTPERIFNAIYHILGFIGIRSAFEVDQIVLELLKVVKANGLIVNDIEVLKHSEKIVVCVMLLLHNTKFKIDDNKQGYCQISCEKTRIDVDKSGEFLDHTESFGNLFVIGCVVSEKDWYGSGINLCYNILDANISVADWCSDKMFSIRTKGEDQPNLLFKELILDVPLCLNDSGKIEIIFS